MKLGELTVPLQRDFGSAYPYREPQSVLVVDEASVQFSREREDISEQGKLGNLKGMAIGLGKAESNKLELIEGLLYISDMVGINGLWTDVIDKFNLLLLQYDICGCQIYVCNYLYWHMFDDLESKRDNGCKVDVFDENTINKRLCYALQHLSPCTIGDHYNDKQYVGQLTREEIIRIDKKFLIEISDSNLPSYILRSEYIKHSIKTSSELYSQNPRLM